MAVIAEAVVFEWEVCDYWTSRNGLPVCFAEVDGCLVKSTERPSGRRTYFEVEVALDFPLGDDMASARVMQVAWTVDERDATASQVVAEWKCIRDESQGRLAREGQSP